MIRDYQAQDLPAMLELIRLNTPNYFDNSEEKLFVDYLQERTNNYFIIEADGNIIGGGIDFEKDSSASISWGIIHPDFHGQGWEKN